jgi:hypothetical protein
MEMDIRDVTEIRPVRPYSEILCDPCIVVCVCVCVCMYAFIYIYFINCSNAFFMLIVKLVIYIKLTLQST